MMSHETKNAGAVLDVNKPLLNKKATTQSENLFKIDDQNDYSESQQKKSSNNAEEKMTETKCVAILEKSNEFEMDKRKKVPPDGGWGWLILIGSTLVNVLVPGTVKSFGVLFVEFLEAFEASPAAAAWIPALCYFLYSSLGPLSSILSLKYSYRTVTLIGGTFAAVGMILSYFANSVVYLCITYGVLVGTGAGLSFPPTVYIVTSYFVRLRGLANGICISGSALGSIILPPILRVILEQYGYRGACLLMGGVTLNVWVAALFYDPVEKHMKTVQITDQSNKSDLLLSSSATDENNGGGGGGEVVVVVDALKAKFMISNEDSMTSLPHIPHNDSFIENFDLSPNNINRSVSSAAMQNLKGANRERKISMPITGGPKSGTIGSRTNMNMNSSSALHAVPEMRRNGAMDMLSQSRLPTSASRRPRSGLPRRSPSTSSFQYVSTPYHGSTLTLQPETFASTFSLRSSNRLNKLKNNDDNDSLSLSTPKRSKFFDITLLKDPLYLVILISNATNAISYTNFIILLPSYALTLGFDKTMGALLLSIVSALDLVGRIGGSALSDLNLCPKAAYFIGGLFVSGISLAVMPFFVDYVMISCCCAVFGLASGIYVGVTAVIMADMLGEERLQSTYGISLFVNGVLQLIGPPICGIWFERMKSYMSLFCTLGIVLVVGSVIWGVVPFIKKPKNSNEDNSDDDDDDNNDDNN